MKRFPKEVKFKYPWRDYQKRVLDELTKHIGDEHLHVVAPPGSGKTILGLEVAIRINRPTLILVPSIALKLQWVDRFLTLFLDGEKAPEWISEDIGNPAFLTVATYQGLHAAISSRSALQTSGKREVTIIESLKAYGIETLVLDEAHHLKNEWWRSLDRLKSSLNLKVIGLTATPPYDVPAAEWNRYLELNGPIDAEVSVPELIIAGDLAPHQDFIHLSTPSKSEEKEIADLNSKMFELITEIKHSDEIVQSILVHPLFVEPEPYRVWIRENIEYYISMIIYMNANKVGIPGEHLKILRTFKFMIPELTTFWLERFLEFYLFAHEKRGGAIFTNYYEDVRKISLPFENQLKRLGLVEKGQVDLKNNRRAAQALSLSLGKLASIEKIITVEEKAMKERLRMVILSDYIRDEYLDQAGDGVKKKQEKLGVIPIFNKIAGSKKIKSRIAVLTGSLVVLPNESLPTLYKLLGQKNYYQIDFNPLTNMKGYTSFAVNDSVRSRIVNNMTKLFESGSFEVLIGTRALLGEGWDAPAINSLLIASSVGSFVLSNQMRGRAIRVDKNDPAKVANIWHLATVSQSGENPIDLEMIVKRFKAFVGISNQGEPTISGGVERLGISFDAAVAEGCEHVNDISETDAVDRNDMLSRWESALSKGEKIVSTIRLPFAFRKEYRREKGAFLYKSLSTLFAGLLSGFAGIALTYYEIWNRVADSVGNYLAISAGSVELFGYFLILFITTLFVSFAFMNLIYYFEMRYISKVKQKAAQALLNTLILTKTIKSPKDQIELFTGQNSEGEVSLRIQGADLYETNLFYLLLNEIFSPPTDARYLIVNQNPFSIFYRRHKYLQVPHQLAVHKTVATLFHNEWVKQFGWSKLLYMRNKRNRELLLELRLKGVDEAQALVDSAIPQIESHWE